MSRRFSANHLKESAIEAIRMVMEKNYITQKDLTKILPASQSLVSRMLNKKSKRQPYSLEALLAFLEKLDCKVELLISYPETKRTVSSVVSREDAIIKVNGVSLNDN
jgi:predicted XRE-type DNA-binding protein